MSNKVLVAYASKSGSTREAAEAVGRVLQESGLEVEVYPVAQIKNVDPYQAVIIGSAVRVGRLLPEALKFAEKHAGELAHKKTAYFTVCMTMHEDTPKNRETAAAYLEPLKRIKEPVSASIFAGKYDSNSVNFVLRFMMKKLQVPEGDFRNWDEITTWSRELAPKLAE